MVGGKTQTSVAQLTGSPIALRTNLFQVIIILFEPVNVKKHGQALKLFPPCLSLSELCTKADPDDQLPPDGMNDSSVAVFI